ncbi:MAG: hypothetical protein AAF960_23520 [Bacteroidota bacterium]
MKYIYSLLLLFILSVTPSKAQNECETLDRIPLPVAIERIMNLPRIAPPPDDQGVEPNHIDRIVFWIHGLGGTEQSWAPAANASVNPSTGISDYPARKIISSLPDYTGAQNVNLDAAARKVQEQLNTTTNTVEASPDTPPDYERRNNFIITHSQGGLVSRWLDMIYENENPVDKTFGGIVTFGTSHGGAAILDNEQLVFDLGADLCKAIGEPAVLEVLDGTPILNIFLAGETISNFVNNTCDFLGNNGLPLLLAGQNQNITNDYHPGAAALTTLKNHDENDNGVLNKVAFYGVEQEPVIWRLLNGLFNKPEEEPAFGANDDGNIQDWAIEEQQKARMKASEWSLIARKRGKNAERLCVLPFFIPNPVSVAACLLQRNRYNDAVQLQESWRNALQFWLSANDKYKIAIGALTFEEKIVQNCDCTGAITGGGTYQYTIPGPCPEGLTSCQTVNVLQRIPNDEPSDGVVTVSSATDYPNAKIGLEMTGSNHQQMRNDENTKRRLRELWEGEHGDFFSTKIKQ